MRRIRVTNPLLNQNYRTYITSDYSSGTSLTVASNTSFAASDYLVVGEPREELTEGKKLDSKSGSTTMTLASALNFAHSKSTSIYKSLWDQVSIESRASSSASWAVLSLSAIQWDNKDNETVYFDSDGTNTTQYRFRFYNSITTAYSEYSPTLTGAVAARGSVRAMVDRVRELTQDKESKIVTDEEIIRAFNDGQDIIYTHNPKYWFLLVDTYKGANGIEATADTSVYSLVDYTTLGHLDSIRYRYNYGADDVIYRLDFKPTVEFDALTKDLNASTDDWPEIYKLLPADSASANGYFQVDPTIKTDNVGTFYPSYFEKMADLDTVDDTTQVPLPKLLEDYAIAYVERIKGNETKAKLYEASLMSDNPDRTPKGLAMLDKMDNQQKAPQGQMKYFWRFRGQKAQSNLYGNKAAYTNDYKKENYF